MIPQCSPRRGYERLQDRIQERIAAVLCSGRYILGDEVRRFEEEFAVFCAAAHCVGCASGTDAIELALRALGVEHSAVATVANTAVATAAGIERSGNRVCFADIDPETCTMSPDSLEELFRTTPGIGAVVVVHLFGCSADMDALLEVARRYGAFVIEDCAQAHGARWKNRRCGSMGAAGCFSFYPTKNLGCLGDGGAVVTSDAVLAEKLAALRQYGWRERYISSFPGINSRLDELQAAILSAKLPFLEEDNRRRRQIAARYTEAIAANPELRAPRPAAGAEHVYHQYVLRCGKRDALQKFLTARGIATAIHYPMPIHRQAAYAARPCPVSLVETERAAREILSLPMFPELTEAEIAAVCAALREFSA